MNVIVNDKYEECSYTVDIKDDIDLNSKDAIDDIWIEIKNKYGIFVDGITIKDGEIKCQLNRYVPNYNNHDYVKFSPLKINKDNGETIEVDIDKIQPSSIDPIKNPVVDEPKLVDVRDQKYERMNEVKYPYYTHKEILNLGLKPIFDENIDIKTLVENIKNLWYDTFQYANEEQKPVIVDKILAHGWNPYIEPTMDNLIKASKNTEERIHNQSIVKLDDRYFDKFINDDRVELDDEKEIDDLIEGFLNQKSKPAKNQKAHVTYLKNKMKKNINNKPISSIVNNIHHEAIEALDDSLYKLLTEGKSSNKNPIFIVVSKTNTPAGKVIGAYTKQKYTHASLSLEPSLTHMYSFTMSNKEGYTIESIKDIMKRVNTEIKVLVMFVSDVIKAKIEEALEFIKSNTDKTKYDMGIILNTLFHKSKDFSEYGMGKLHFVCSEFVAYIVKMADIDIDYNKSINLVTPGDLGDIKHERVYLLYEGPSEEYNENTITRVLRKLKSKSKLIKESMLYEMIYK